MLLGAMSHLFRGSPAAIAAALVQHGLNCVQLTPSFPGLRFQEPHEIVAERCQQAAEPFQQAGVAIAALSGSSQLMDPDLDRRHKGIVRLHALIRHCRDFGTTYLVSETGSLNPESPWTSHPPNRSREAWAELRTIVAETLAVAADQGVTILLKPGPTHVLATLDDALRLRAELPSPHLGFVLDPAAFLWDSSPTKLDARLEGLVEHLGPWAPLVHAKDIQFGEEGTVSMPRVGRGVLDYGRFMRLLNAQQRKPPIILEHVQREELTDAVQYRNVLQVDPLRAETEHPRW
jgi:sugar phosphate isomerase/epimerase